MFKPDYDNSNYKYPFNRSEKMVEFLKTNHYAKVVEEKIPNKETLKAIHDVESGKVNSYTSAKVLIESLKKESRCIK